MTKRQIKALNELYRMMTVRERFRTGIDFFLLLMILILAYGSYQNECQFNKEISTLSESLASLGTKHNGLLSEFKKTKMNQKEFNKATVRSLSSLEVNITRGRGL